MTKQHQSDVRMRNDSIQHESSWNKGGLMETVSVRILPQVMTKVGMDLRTLVVALFSLQTTHAYNCPSLCEQRLGSLWENGVL